MCEIQGHITNVPRETARLEAVISPDTLLLFESMSKNIVHHILAEAVYQTRSYPAALIQMHAGSSHCSGHSRFERECCWLQVRHNGGAESVWKSTYPNAQARSPFSQLLSKS